MERIPSMMADITSLQRDLSQLRADFEESERDRKVQHQENARALQQIQMTLHDFGFALKIGRYIMHIFWGLAGTAIGALAVKWISR